MLHAVKGADQWYHLWMGDADSSETQNFCWLCWVYRSISDAIRNENLLSHKKIHKGFAVEDEVSKLLAAKQIDEVLVFCCQNS